MFKRSLPQLQCCVRLRFRNGRVWLALALSSLLASSVRGDDEAFFERYIRPLLVDHCLECHGPSQQEGGLRLDSRAALLKGGEGGSVLVAGKPDESRLLAAIERQGDLQMPPDEPLEDAAVAAFRQWIEAGAVWPGGSPGGGGNLFEQHWSLQPVQRPPLSNSLDLDWAQRRADGLLLESQAALQITPSPRADRRTLIRRLSYDLRGLPPDPDEVEQFLGDPAPDAFARLVDRWLASPRFGEQWARHWLDVARYADNKGYVFFEQHEFPWAYTYRNYVIEAFNTDVTYDRFLLEQLAADQLDDLESPARLAALGFLTVGGHFINNTHDIIDDRIDVVTRGLLGLTVTCARCHDHKYDPISQADYYALYGVFSSSQEPLVPPPLDPAAAGKLTEYNTKLEQLQQELADFVTGKYEGLVHGARTRADEYLQAVYERRSHPTAEDFMLIADPDDINPAMITRWESYLQRVATPTHPVWGPWAELTELAADDWGAEAAQRLATPDRQWNALLIERLTSARPADIGGLAKVYGELFREADERWRQSLGEQPELAGLADPSLEALRQELYGAGTPADLPPQLDWGFLSLFPDRATQDTYKKLLGALEKWLVDPPEAPPRAMALVDSQRPADAPIFLRGNPHRPGEVVPRRFLTVLSEPNQRFTQGSGRLEMAQAIVDPDNPLTDRVLVNRCWTHLMGTPLVSTPGDFGLRSQPPVLPTVLDEWVSEFRDCDRSLKSLVRAMVLSSTYQQQSHLREELASIDPENHYAWRQQPKRLQFEAMRDTLLVAAGRLSSRVGGPSEDLLNHLGQRRTLYTFIDRLDVPPLLTTFDFPNPAATSPLRQRTTVPPQALYWLNRPQVLTIAEEILRRGDLADLPLEPRLDRLCQVIWSRPPTDDERQWATEFLRESAETVDADRTADVPPERWVQLVHALLMSNETVFID